MPGPSSRSATEVGPGDFVKVGGRVLEIKENSAHGAERTPRRWSVTTTDGRSHDMMSIERYYKAGDDDIPTR